MDNIVEFNYGEPAELRLVGEEYGLILEEYFALSKKSAYKTQFDYSIYNRLEERSKRQPIRGGITFKSPLKLANSHYSCQQCLYSFELDTYGRGCFHDCAYCYAKAELVQYSYWNNPIPVPININTIWKLFYTVFETDKSSKWRDLLLKKIPLRIGSMSDPFMMMDSKYRVSHEILKILSYYNYPYIIFTRSDLIAHEDYMNELRSDLCSVQFSISSTNDDLNGLIEPGAPSAKRRLKAAKKLSSNGIWTTIRLNPFFPIYPDGYFSDPKFNHAENKLHFPYSSFDMIEEIADYGIQSVLAGFVRLSPYSINQIRSKTGVDLKPFFRNEKVIDGSRDYHFSQNEITEYYRELSRRSKNAGIEFSTCYIGYGEDRFWSDQKFWSNKSDCCNAKSKVEKFRTDSRQISFEKRVRLSSNKSGKPTSGKLHSPLAEESSGYLV